MTIIRTERLTKIIINAKKNKKIKIRILFWVSRDFFLHWCNDSMKVCFFLNNPLKGISKTISNNNKKMIEKKSIDWSIDWFNDDYTNGWTIFSLSLQHFLISSKSMLLLLLLLRLLNNLNVIITNIRLLSSWCPWQSYSTINFMEKKCNGIIHMNEYRHWWFFVVDESI